MKRAVVTGATGAIGSALVRELAESGVEVLVLVRKESARSRNIPRHPLVRQIGCDLAGLANLPNETGQDYDVFYHLAWAGTTGAARDDMYLQNRNVRYALDAVTAAERFGCRMFVGAGSQAEYGPADGKLKPDSPVKPETGYGYAKLCAGQMTRSLARQLGMRHVWVRILSVYGPNDGPQSMVMSTIRKLRSGVVPEFTRAEQMWDYLYSRDAARALRLVGEMCGVEEPDAAGQAHSVESSAERESLVRSTEGESQVRSAEGESQVRSAEGSMERESQVRSAENESQELSAEGSAERESQAHPAKRESQVCSAEDKSPRCQEKEGERQPGSLLPDHKMGSRIYVLGSGHARPLAEYITEIRDIVAPGMELGIGMLPYTPGQVMYLCADTSALERDTGWRPRTSFADGIREILSF